MNPHCSSLQRIRLRLLVAGQWCAALSLAAAPLNKPATSILIVLSLLFSVLGADMRLRWKAALREPVVIGFLAWFAVLLASAVHAWASSGSTVYGESFLWTCVYPAVLASLLRSPALRWRALAAFAVAVAFVLVVSYLMQFGVVPQRAVATAVPAMQNTVFKEYTQQGLSSLILLAMVVAFACHVRSRRLRIGLSIAALAILCNVALVIQSRTTYLVLLPLATYWAYRLLSRRLKGWRVALATGMVALVLAAGFVSTPDVQRRMVSAVDHEVDTYLTSQQPTSSGIRLWLWQQTLPIIADAPLFGHGLKQWEPIYVARMRDVPGSAPFITGHPHQEILLILAEQGFFGLFVFALLVVALFIHISRQDDPQKGIFTSILIIYLFAGLANGLWSDFTHRHVFVLLLACLPLAASRALPATERAR